jgi:hypothetical protein
MLLNASALFSPLVVYIHVFITATSRIKIEPVPALFSQKPPSQDLAWRNPDLKNGTIFHITKPL